MKDLKPCVHLLQLFHKVKYFDIVSWGRDIGTFGENRATKLKNFQEALTSICKSEMGVFPNLEGVQVLIPESTSLDPFPVSLKHLSIISRKIAPICGDISSYLSPHATTLTYCNLNLRINKDDYRIIGRRWYLTRIPRLPTLRHLGLHVDADACWTVLHTNPDIKREFDLAFFLRGLLLVRSFSKHVLGFDVILLRKDQKEWKRHCRPLHPLK